jgi:hypothetical protein
VIVNISNEEITKGISECSRFVVPFLRYFGYQDVAKLLLLSLRALRFLEEMGLGNGNGLAPLLFQQRTIRYISPPKTLPPSSQFFAEYCQ